jgi:hypothetical protein
MNKRWIETIVYLILIFSIPIILLIFAKCSSPQKIQAEQSNERIEKLEEVLEKKRQPDGRVILTETEYAWIMQELGSCKADRLQCADFAAHSESELSECEKKMVSIKEDADLGRKVRRFFYFIIGSIVLLIIGAIVWKLKPKVTIG